MVKVKVCDICYYREGKMQEGKWTVGFKGRNSVKIDACEKHKTIMKDEKVSFDNQHSWFTGLLNSGEDKTDHFIKAELKEVKKNE